MNLSEDSEQQIIQLKEGGSIMENAQLAHKDCRNFAPVDVVKGLCHLHKQMVLIDSPVCEKYKILPKCESCSNFKPDCTEAKLGICLAEATEPWTYAELIAVTCENYSAK
ncbi:MAG: 4-hydroxyphenylacetate decarboxylase small subunit [Thermincola sp.]|jgi:4-hydroxyphenylacetate decarboxylase small subunit|nr:4-hydroxyphenylacetate decarboxylase small subunit [Thermincola sp.]